MTRKQNSISQNAIFNVVYKSFMYVFPLIISGYIGRVLLSDGVGRVSFVQNIVSYFTAIVALGIPTYGTREIAKCDSADERDRVFSSLFLINATSTIICSIAYYSIVLFVPYFHSNLELYLIAGIQIVFNFINIDWLYQGLEEYRYIAIRSLVIRSISLICIFVFVKNKEDAWIYLLITCIVNVGNYVLNAIKARTIVHLTFHDIEIKPHLYSVFIMLATVLAIELYTKVDTTFIGLMLTDSDVGYYTYADRIVKIPITVFAAISAVILPRLSLFYKSNEKQKFHELLQRIDESMLFLVIPACVGMALLSTDYVVALFGSDFEPAGLLLKVLSPLIIIMSLGNLFGTQAIIAIGQERKKFIATLIAGVLNIIMTPILISYTGAVGACFASVLSEGIVLIIYILILRKYDKPTVRKSVLINVFISSILMVGYILLLKKFELSHWFNTIIGTLGGALIYGVCFIFLDKEVRIQIKKKICG